MARIQLILPDEDRDRFQHQAKREGLTMSAWLRAAAKERLAKAASIPRFDSVEQLERFFTHCDHLENGQPEPDWEQHLEVMKKSRETGSTDT